MKFSVAALVSGVVLIAAPLLAYAYQLHVSESIAIAALAARGTFNFPELPIRWFFVSSAAGVMLAILGYLSEKQAIRAAFSGKGRAGSE